MNVFAKAPNVVVVCATVLVLAVIIGITVLSFEGRNTQDLTALINTLLSAAGALAGTGGLLYAGAAARSAHNTEDQLNGELDAKIRTAIAESLLAHDVEVHGVAPTVPGPVTLPMPHSPTET